MGSFNGGGIYLRKRLIQRIRGSRAAYSSSDGDQDSSFRLKNVIENFSNDGKTISNNKILNIASKNLYKKCLTNINEVKKNCIKILRLDER